MYGTSKLGPRSVSFLNSLAGTPSELVALALGRAIAVNLNIPTAEVKSAPEFYKETTLNEARSLISQTSDLFAFDIERVKETVRVFWMVRYFAAFPQKKLYGAGAIPTESVFLGYGNVISAAELIFIEQNTNKLVILFNGFSEILGEMILPEQEEQEA